MNTSDAETPGPDTGARPIYERRFDADARTASADMDLDR